MRWLWKQKSTLARQRSTLLDDDRSQPLYSRPRGLSPLTNPVTIETQLSNAASPYHGIDPDADNINISRGTLLALKEGCTMKTLIKCFPDDVLTVLKEISVAPLGTLEAKDSQVLAAFGKEKMLTRGHVVATYGDWERDWREVLEVQAGKKVTSNVSVGWEQNVTLGAYVVQLRDIAKKQSDSDDLVDLLMQKYTAGAATREIWEFPAVEAVINYHWNHWAKRLLAIIFAFFMIWTISFGVYMALYIEGHDAPHLHKPKVNTTNLSLQDDENMSHPARRKSPSTAPEPPAPSRPLKDDNERTDRIKGSFTDDRRVAKWTHILNFLCFAAMCPFAIEEYWTVISLGKRWLNLGNLFDMGAINLQAFILFCHLTDTFLMENWFGYLLALQIILLSIRLLRFVKLLGGGTTFLDTALAVIFDARYWLGYIVFTGITASLALAAIYKRDYEFQGKGYSDFSGTWKSTVTTFQIIFGNFDNRYIFASHYTLLTFLFFLGFQVLMTITVLNLIIATMADSYSKYVNLKVSQYYKARAELIQELSTLHLPGCMTFDPAPYIHFLVVEKKHSKSENEEIAGTTLNIDDEELQKKVDTLTERVDEMMTMMSSIIERIEAMQNGTL